MRTRLSRAALPLAAAVLASVAALPVAAAAAAPVPVPASRAAADHPTYIVTVRPDLDPAEVAEAYGITPTHVYRDALNGFAARLSPNRSTTCAPRPRSSSPSKPTARPPARAFSSPPHRSATGTRRDPAPGLPDSRFYRR